MSSAKRMEDAGHFVIRPTANLKIMASLLQWWQRRHWAAQWPQ
jgi:hypothetical protein